MRERQKKTQSKLLTQKNAKISNTSLVFICKCCSSYRRLGENCWERSNQDIYSSTESLRRMSCINIPNSLYTSKLGNMKGTSSPKAKTIDLEKNETKLNHYSTNWPT